MKRRIDHADPHPRIRGDILVYARVAGSTGVTIELLRIAFTLASRERALDALDQNCAYLVEKGYLSREHLRDEISNVERYLYRLTDKGADLANRTTPPDPEVRIVC